MDAKKPLRTVARPKGSPFAERFARDLLPLFDQSSRLSAEAAEYGLLIGGIWEPDLDRAYKIVREAFAGEVLWGPTQLHYEQGRWPQEPFVLVTVRTPDDYLGNVIGDLLSRRGLITGHKKVGDANIVTVQAPLAELNGYLSVLERLTQGSASAEAEFDSYQTAPPGSGPPDEPMSAALRA